MTRHLLERGRRRIAFAGAQLDPRVLQRLDGWRHELGQAGLYDPKLEWLNPAPSSLALGGRIVERERQDTSVGQADTPSSAFAARLLQHEGRRPVHVVKRQPCVRQRPLPSWPSVGDLLLRLALNGLAEIGLRRAKLDAPGAALVTRKPLLQCLLH